MVEFLIKNLFCICGINFAGIRHPLTSIGFCHFCTCFALITFLILFILLFNIEQFYQTRPQERSIPLTGLNVYLISCINKDY